MARATDIMMAHPIAWQLRSLQTLVELGVDKNTTVVFPSPLMSTIGELGQFLGREDAASAAHEEAGREVPVPVQRSPETADQRAAAAGRDVTAG